MRDSITTSALRSFFTAFFAVMGVCLGLLIILLAFGLLSDTSAPETETVYSAEILPNANNDRKLLASDAPIILRLNVEGVIGLENLSAQSIRTQLQESRENDLSERVKAVLVHINTPGGTVIDSDGIYRALKSYKELYKTPIYAYVDGMCASGGMYVAAAVDKIYASDVSLIGSVGVVSPPFFNVAQTLDKIGISSLTISAGTGKDDMNPFRPWRPDEAVMYQDIISHYYNQFVALVAANRPKLDKEKLIADYGAHVFPAAKAETYGFIDDSSASYSTTLKALAEAANLKEDEYQVIQLTKKTWFSELFGSGNSVLFSGKVKHQIELSPYLDPAIRNQFLYLYSPGF